MNERWLTPKPIKGTEQNDKRRDIFFSGFLTLALLIMLSITYYAKHLLKVPVLLCFLILVAVSFIAFIKDKPSADSNQNWLIILRKLFKVIAISLFWILLINKLL